MDTAKVCGRVRIGLPDSWLVARPLGCEVTESRDSGEVMCDLDQHSLASLRTSPWAVLVVLLLPFTDHQHVIFHACNPSPRQQTHSKMLHRQQKRHRATSPTSSAHSTEMTDPQSSQPATKMAKLTNVESELPLESPKNEVKRTTTTNPPFFNLPRELRDQIYDLVALSEDVMFCDITIRKDKAPQKVISARREASHARTRFEVEYMAAIERRVKLLMTETDWRGMQLSYPGPPDPTWLNERVAFLRMEVSRQKRADSKICQNVHTVTMAVPLHSTNRIELDRQARSTSAPPMLKFTFMFPDNKNPNWPHWVFEFPWVDHKIDNENIFVSPPGSGSLIHQAPSVAKGTNWNGCLREYMVWQRYFVRYAQNSHPEN